MIAKQRTEIKKLNFDKRLGTAEGASRFALVDIFSIVFGIALSSIGLLSNPLVIDLQTISQLDVFSLIGVGLGIGDIR